MWAALTGGCEHSLVAHLRGGHSGGKESVPVWSQSRTAHKQKMLRPGTDGPEGLF